MTTLAFVTFLLVSGSAWATTTSTLVFKQAITPVGFFLFSVDGVDRLLLCDQFFPNVTTEPYAATVATLADLSATQLGRNGDPLALVKYQQVAILDLRAYADPTLAPDVVQAIRSIVDGQGVRSQVAIDLLKYAAAQNPANFDLSGFKIFASGTARNPGAQEQTGFFVPEPSTFGFVFLGGLMGVAYKRRWRV